MQSVSALSSISTLDTSATQDGASAKQSVRIPLARSSHARRCLAEFPCVVVVCPARPYPAVPAPYGSRRKLDDSHTAYRALLGVWARTGHRRRRPRPSGKRIRRRQHGSRCLHPVPRKGIHLLIFLPRRSIGFQLVTTRGSPTARSRNIDNSSHSAGAPAPARSCRAGTTSHRLRTPHCWLSVISDDSQRVPKGVPAQSRLRPVVHVAV